MTWKRIIRSLARLSVRVALANIERKPLNGELRTIMTVLNDTTMPRGMIRKSVGTDTHPSHRMETEPTDVVTIIKDLKATVKKIGDEDTTETVASSRMFANMVLTEILATRAIEAILDPGGTIRQSLTTRVFIAEEDATTSQVTSWSLPTWSPFPSATVGVDPGQIPIRTPLAMAVSIVTVESIIINTITIEIGNVTIILTRILPIKVFPIFTRMRRTTPIGDERSLCSLSTQRLLIHMHSLGWGIRLPVWPDRAMLTFTMMEQAWRAVE